MEDRVGCTHTNNRPAQPVYEKETQHRKRRRYSTFSKIALINLDTCSNSTNSAGPSLVMDKEAIRHVQFIK